MKRLNQLKTAVKQFLQGREKRSSRWSSDTLIAAGILKWGPTQAGDMFTLNGIGYTLCDSDEDWVYDKDYDTLYLGSVPVYSKGIWATLTSAINPEGNTRSASSDRL